MYGILLAIQAFGAYQMSLINAGAQKKKDSSIVSWSSLCHALHHWELWVDRFVAESEVVVRFDIEHDCLQQHANHRFFSW